MEENKNVFATLNAVDVSEKIKEKKDLKYLSWASAWAEVKKRYPDATYKVYKQTDESGNSRYWHDDGRTGWVEVGVTINGLEHIMTLAIMDFRNNAIPADNITSVDANKSMMRCLVKACAMHGLALYIYEGEDLPENTSKIIDLQDEVAELAKKKSALSEKAKGKAIELCKAAEKSVNPDMEDEFITGKISNINDADVLEKLKKQLLAVRK